jgi:GNAT superfamily N-acetyltransferase
VSTGRNPQSPRTRRSTIRRSTPDDIKAIHDWLLDEKDRGVHGNFLCNWCVIEQAHLKGELLVYADSKTSLPVGFQLGALVSPGILQVRSEYRGRGIGRKLVERCVALANKRDQCLLYIECTPSSSIPFWKRMGFTVMDSRDGKNYAYRILNRQLALPDGASHVKVAIRFYPEDRKRQEATNPYITLAPRAKLARDGTLYLGERVLFHEIAYPDARDVVVEIEVNGGCLFLDKAKYPEARRLGVTRCKNGFYIDKINTKAILAATDVLARLSSRRHG